MQEDQGIKAVRRCSEAEIKLIQHIYNQRKPAQFKKDQITWFNLFSDGEYKSNEQLDIEFRAFVDNLVSELFPQSRMHVVIYGFVFNPARCSKNQQFHIDYDPHMESVMITMANHTTNNSTQFISYLPAKGPMQGPKYLARYAKDELQLLERSECDAIQIRQLICKAYTILHMKQGTVHRGIGNGEDYDRPLFYINLSKKELCVDEPVDHIGTINSEYRQ